VFAIIGLQSKPETTFDAALFAYNACDNGKPLLAIALTFGETVREPLKRAMDYSRRHDPEVYARDYRGKTILEAVFAGFRGEKPGAVVKSFSLSNADALDEKVTPIPDEAGNNTALSGAKAAANLFLTKHRGVVTDYPELIRKLIGSEVEDQPTEVDLPISIVEIGPAGFVWLDRGKCR